MHRLCLFADAGKGNAPSPPAKNLLRVRFQGIKKKFSLSIAGPFSIHGDDLIALSVPGVHGEIDSMSPS